MTFRDDDDDTSPGKMTQGGHKVRGGHASWLVLLVVVVAIAVAVWLVAKPHRPSRIEDGGPLVSRAPHAPAAPNGPEAPIR